MAAMPVQVKICGMTNIADARVAADAGADALGFIFHEASPRFVTVEKAASIIRQLDRSIMKVGVFVDAPEELVRRALTECHLDLLQFHGTESPAYCNSFGARSMKAFQMRDGASLKPLPAYETFAWLLDAWSPSQAGGIGRTFNWELAVEARALGRPIFLAGGLTPENVGEAIQRVRPYGVDVSSGVEFSPGKKDHGKVKAFIEAARSVAAA